MQLLTFISLFSSLFLPLSLQDESTLIWASNGKEKTLKLASVSKILSGQRTVRKFKYLKKNHLNSLYLLT
jgi:hypothetical protein